MSLFEELMQLERKTWDANLAGDGGYYDRFLTDDAVVVSPWGVQGKPAVVAAITVNALPYTGYELDQERLVPLGPDAALVTYRAVVRGERGGEPFTHTVYATSAYRREGGVWRGPFHQQSLVADRGN
jgi:ketosteroid isomerase-like protein